MAKKEKKNKKEKKEKAAKGGKKEKKEKKRKKGRKGKGEVAGEAVEQKKSPEENWLYYSEGPISFIIAVLIFFCVVDVILAIYAVAYTKRVERESVAAAEAAASADRTVNGQTWFQDLDGNYVHADGSASSDTDAPAIPGQAEAPAENAPAESAGAGADETAEPPGAQEGEEPAQQEASDTEASAGEEPPQAEPSAEPPQNP